MQESTKYAIFETKWGYFGLAAGDNGLLRSCLPLAGPDEVESHLLQNLRKAEYDKSLFKTVQEQIIAYFKGAHINFSPDIPLILDGFTPFAKSVLTACRDIEFGYKATYSQLAKKAGRANAARAVGGVMAKNPLPLIIPCHRVVRRDGKLGGFSAQGGVALKEKMLQHENAALNVQQSR
jgi:O-6-methylguanine DNA methyltransferase